jgi:hypothetical protein
MSLFIMSLYSDISKKMYRKMYRKKMYHPMVSINIKR